MSYINHIISKEDALVLWKRLRSLTKVQVIKNTYNDLILHGLQESDYKGIINEWNGFTFNSLDIEHTINKWDLDGKSQEHSSRDLDMRGFYGEYLTYLSKASGLTVEFLLYQELMSI